MDHPLRFQILDTGLIGEIRVVVGDEGLVAIQLGESVELPPDPAWRHIPDPDCPVIRQLTEYFTGERERFDLDLALAGTPFQMAVWRALVAIPYGRTLSYGEVAARVGKPRAVRAVGAANNRNRIPIVIPCHRVIGATGELTGYAGGVAIKSALLKLEGSLLVG